MKRMIDGLWSPSMKWILAFIMKPTWHCQWQLPFSLIRGPHHLQQPAPTGKPEDDCTIGSVSIEFLESHCQANENWREPASEEITKVVPVAFKGYLCYKTLNPQNVLSEAQFKNFFIS